MWPEACAPPLKSAWLVPVKTVLPMLSIMMPLSWPKGKEVDSELELAAASDDADMEPQLSESISVSEYTCARPNSGWIMVRIIRRFS